MKLIADCGSTKIDWCIVDNGVAVKQFASRGMNAVMLTTDAMTQQFAADLAPEVAVLHFDAVYFYGAGCISDDVCRNVADALAANLSAERIEVQTDLLCAARAVCGNQPGIACILGTGSNSCYYDGTRICDNVSPLGFILGDEGSGAVLGKLLLSDVLKKQLPEHVCKKFLDEYHLDRVEIIKRVYREPQANRFLASVTPFLRENISEPAIHSLVLNSFISFFKRNVLQYSNCQQLSVNFVGSVAYHYQDILAEAAAACGCTVGKIIKSPMPGLLAYHANN
jgi:N-acetylglucosamine kinase-like BadF-type ATPase